MHKLKARISAILSGYWDRLDKTGVRKNLLQSLPFWIASAITGLVAVFYAKLFSLAEITVLWFAGKAWWALFITCPLFFFLGWYVVNRFAPAARGSGIPQVMAAIQLSNPIENHKVGYLLGLKIMVVKIIGSLFMVLGGGAIGREGPTIQIAGSVFKWVNDLTPASWPKVPRKNMIITGAAAGLAAAFNTPLGGIVFAIEELAKNHFKFFRTPLFVAVIIAGLTAQALLGPYLYLGYPAVTHTNWYIIFPIMGVALVAGMSGGLMSKTILAILKYKSRLENQKSHLFFLLGVALIVATIGSLVTRDALGPGKEVMNELLFTPDKKPEWYLPIVRFVTPVLSFTAGGAGGIFAPALSAGASIGAVCAHVFQFTGANANLLILTGMIGLLTGITRSPFTSAILVLEMTDRHSVIFYFMIAGLLGNFGAWMVERKSLYGSLMKDYLAETHKASEDLPQHPK
jgi:H+/Cl- antiporter ClcA